MKRIYIAGCGGMLGEAFYKQFKDDYLLKCTDIDLNDIWLEYLDFRDFEKYKKDVKDFNADYLFHLGAYTDLEYCELHEDDTYATNTESVKHAVKIANDLEIPILYISTAGIFDGKKDVYDESDQPNPIGHYAKSKYLGEKYVVENANNYLVCRAGWMMGGGPKKDKKFIQKIMKQLKDGKNKLSIVNDKLGTPTYTHDFAINVKLLLEKGMWGLYNMVCKGLTSRLEVGQELILELSLKEEIIIHEVTSEYFSVEYFADRPECERLNNKRLDDLGLNNMRDWRVALKDYLGTYYSTYL